MVNEVCDLLAEVHTSYPDEKMDHSIESVVEIIGENIKMAMLEGGSIVFLETMLGLTDKLISRD